MLNMTRLQMRTLLIMVLLIVIYLIGSSVRSPSEEMVTLKGTVQNPEGYPLGGIQIHVHEEKDGKTPMLVNVKTSSDGTYYIQVPPRETYLLWITAGQKERRVNVFPYIPFDWEIKREGRSVIKKDFTLHPAGNLVLKAYEHGHLLRMGKLKAMVYNQHPFENYLWSTNMNNIPPPIGRLMGAGNEYTRKHGWDRDKATPVFLVPLNQPQKLQINWKVPGFGKVLLEVDNGGEGYLFTKKGEQKVINLNYELAKTRYRYLHKKFEEYKEQGYEFSKEVEEGIEKARKFLKKAEAGWGKVLEAEKAKCADKSLRNSLFTSEQLEYEKAQQAIERNRKHSAKVKLTDSEGNDLANAEITYRQISHNFKFGFSLCRVSRAAKSKHLLNHVTHKLKQAGFNLAMIDIGQFMVPSKFGKFAQYEKALRDKDFDFKIHQVIPLFPPDKFRKMAYPELKKEIHQYTSALVRRFPYARYYMVSEELSYKSHNPFNLSKDQTLGLVNEASKVIKELNPDAKLSHGLIMPFQWRVPQPWTVWDKHSKPRYSMHPFTWAKLLKQRVFDFDIIDLEVMPGYYNYKWGKRTFAIIDLARASRYLDWYSTLGKNIHVAEFRIPSRYLKQHGETIWHRRWDEKLQAEYTRKFYTIAYSKPPVKGLFWRWPAFFVDPQKPTLFKEDYQPNQTYYALKNLITKKWSTHGKTATDSRGQFSLRGFAGDYQVTVKKGEETLSGTFHLPQKDGKVIQVILKPSTK